MTCPDCGNDRPTPGCPACQTRHPTLFPVPPPPRPKAHRVAKAILADTARLQAIYRSQGRIAALNALERPVIVALVGCSKGKYAERAPARRLYGGPLFPLALQYAERIADEVYILSAKHGLVEPDRELANYDRSMKDLGARQRERWGEGIAAELELRYPNLKLTLIGLAGREYLDPLTKPLMRNWRWGLMERPLAYLPVGKRRRWLAEQLRTVATFRRSPLPLPQQLAPPPTEATDGPQPG